MSSTTRVLPALLLLAACSPTSAADADASADACVIPSRPSGFTCELPLSCFCQGSCPTLASDVSRYGPTCGGGVHWSVRFDCPGTTTFEWFDTTGAHADSFDDAGTLVNHADYRDDGCTAVFGKKPVCSTGCQYLCGHGGGAMQPPCGPSDAGLDAAPE